MTRADHALAERVTTIAFEQPQRIRAQVVAAMRAAIPNNLGMFVKCSIDPAGVRRFTGLVVNGDREVVERVLPFAEAPALDCPWLPPHTDPGVIDRFVRIRSYYDPAYQSSFEAEQKIWSRLETGDQVRAVLCDGFRLLGWIGLVRRGSGQVFSRREEATLQCAVGGIKAALAAAEALESRDLEQGLAAVYRPDGQVEHASAGFRAWLDADRRVHLRARVRAVDRGSEDAGIQIISGAETRLVRLDGLGGARYLVTVDHAELLRIGPEYRLTDRQRAIAELAAAGATSGEIARTLMISANTVKVHLKNVYDRLGVASRIELADAMRGEAERGRRQPG